MKSEPHIVYRGFGPSEALTERIYLELDELERISDRITACRVVLELPHKHKRHGKHFLIKVELFMPGKVLTIDRDPPDHDNFEDAYAALNETFAKARRLLLDYTRVRRGHTKHHEAPEVGVVTQLFGDRDFGFLRSPDGHDVYFHRNAVLNDGWGRLEVGSRVTWAEEQGNDGPQASTVRVVREPRSAEPGELSGARE